MICVNVYKDLGVEVVSVYVVFETFGKFKSLYKYIEFGKNIFDKLEMLEYWEEFCKGYLIVFRF